MLKARAACCDRGIWSAMLIDLDQLRGIRMVFDGPLSGGDRYEENQHQAGVPGYRGFRARSSRFGSMVTRRRSFAVDRKRGGEGRATVDPRERRGRCATTNAACGGRRSGRRCSRCRHRLCARAGKRRICLPLSCNAARGQIPGTLAGARSFVVTIKRRGRSSDTLPRPFARAADNGGCVSFELLRSFC
jgi:hypothetical protein